MPPPTRSSPPHPRVTARAPQRPLWAGANAGAKPSPATPLLDGVCGRFGQPTPRSHDVSSRGRQPWVGESEERCGSYWNQKLKKKISREETTTEKDKTKKRRKGPGFEVERRRRREDHRKRGRKAEVGAKADRTRKTRGEARPRRGHKSTSPAVLSARRRIRLLAVGGSRSRILASAPSAASPRRAGAPFGPTPAARGSALGYPMRFRAPFDPRQRRIR